MGRGEALGLDFKLPNSFIGQPQAAAQEAPQDFGDSGIPSPVKQGDYLAHVEGLSDKYYETAGMLKAFAHDQAKKGVDVTQPDYSQPGGGELFKTWQKLTAVLNHTSNDLANSNDIDKTMMKLQAEGKITQNPGFDPRQQMSATMNPNQMFTSTDLNQTTQNAATDLSQTYYTNRDAQAKNQAVRNPLISFYEKRMQEDPGNAQYYQNQIAALPQATAQTAYQQLIPHNGRGPKQEDLLNRAELIKSIKRGILTDDQTAINTLKLMTGVESVDYVNDGDRMGIEVYQKGSDQPSFIDLQSADGGAGEINAMINKITGQAKIPNEKVFEFETGVKIPKSKAKPFLDGIKSAITNVETQTPEGVAAITKLSELAGEVGLYTPEQESIISIEPTTRFFWQTTPSRLKVTYYKNDKKGNATSKVDEKEISISDNKEWVNSFIKNNATTIANKLGAGFHNDEETPVQQPTSPKGKVVSLSTLQSKIGSPGFEGYSLDELKEFYTNQGYTIK